MRTIAERNGGFRALALGSDGRTLAADWGRDIKVWDVKSGSERFALVGHRSQVKAVDIRGDGQRLVSASDDGSVRIWDLETKKELTTLAHGLRPPLSGIAYNPDGEWIVAYGQDGAIHVWDAATDELIRDVCESSAPITAIALRRAKSAPSAN